MIAWALIALPLAFQESTRDTARNRIIAFSKRILVRALLALVDFASLYQDFGY